MNWTPILQRTFVYSYVWLDNLNHLFHWEGLGEQAIYKYPYLKALEDYYDNDSVQTMIWESKK